MSSQRNRARGVLLGLACGDALGRPVEFKSARAIQNRHGRVTEMLGDGTHGKPAGTITDDTDLALCIARSLVECGAFDGADIADRFVEWFDSGPFDVGIMTGGAISEYRRGTPWEEAGRRVWEHRPEGSNAGNGSIMRCAPHALAFADAPPGVLVDVSRNSSAITHFDPRCTYGCAVLNLTVAGLLLDHDSPLTDALERVASEAPDVLVDTLRPVPADVDPSELKSTGYVVDTLQTAMFHALTADTAEQAIVEAVNRGDDSDTVGAVTGVLAGARFGADALPERWLDTLDVASELGTLADELLDHDIQPNVSS